MQSKIKYLLILCLLSTNIVFSQVTHEQNTQDSVLITRLKNENKLDSIIEIFSVKAKDYDLLPVVYHDLIYAHLIKEDFINSLFFADKLIKIAENYSDTTLTIKAYRNRIKALYYLRRHDDAIKTCLQLNKLFRKQDSLSHAVNLISLGLLYNEIDEIDKAYSVYKSIKTEDIKKTESEASYYNNFSNIYGSMGYKDSCILYIKLALQIAKHDKDTGLILMSYANVSSSYMDKRDYEMALKYIDSTKFITNYDKDTRVYEFVYENFYVAYINLNMIDSAYVYLQKIKELNQALFHKKLDTEIKEITASNKREIRLVKKVELADKSLEKAQRQRLWIIIGFLILVIVLGAIISLLRFKNIKSINNNILTEQKLLRSQMTPHFIFNSLSVIQGMILSNENKNASKYLSKFSKLMRLILENSRTKFVSLDDEINAIEYYLELQNLRFNNNLNWSVFSAKDFDRSVLIPPMIIQPFVENALEHGFKQSKENCELTVELKKDSQKITCIIKDNGIGIDSAPKKKNQTKKSLSTDITTERLIILSKELKVESKLLVQDRKQFNEQGTIVTITIPYKTYE